MSIGSTGFTIVNGDSSEPPAVPSKAKKPSSRIPPEESFGMSALKTVGMGAVGAAAGAIAGLIFGAIIGASLPLTAGIAAVTLGIRSSSDYVMIL